MRKRRAPFEGYTRDNDMLAFWRCDETAATPATISSYVDYGGTVRNMGVINTLLVATTNFSLFSPDPTGSLLFTFDYYRSSGIDDSAILKSDFSVALWYDATTMSTATSGFLQFADATTVTTSLREYFGLYFDNTTDRAIYSVRTGTTNTILGISPALPKQGHLALTVTSGGSIAWYSNGSLTAASSFSDVRSTITSTTIGCWSLGGSFSGMLGGAGTHNANNVAFDEIAVWDKELKAEKIRELYSSCVRNWDQDSLESTNNHQTITRVLIADANGTMQDVTSLCGRNWLLSVDISEEVDNPAIQASIVLTRKAGTLLDISPLNEQAYRAVLDDSVNAEQLIDFRRRIVVERAFVPQMYSPQGWEWELRFDGFIDSWDMSDDTINLTCVDKSAPLIDQFIMDQRAYNFYTSNKAMEAHLQEIVDDNIPKIPTDAGDVLINYKGGNPSVYTEAGTAASPWINNAGWNLRYNDVASGSVLAALQSVTDQTGALIGYRFHEPWHEYRLETNFPKRNKSFQIKAVAPVSSGIEVTTYEPHGFNVGSIASVYGTSSLNFGGSVASVIDFYRIRFDNYTGGSTATETAGSLVFQQHLALTAQDIFSVNPVKSDIASIRNHAIVKYQRVDSLASAPVSSIATSAASSNLVFVTLPSSVDLSAIDPDKLGITFTISECTGAFTAFNANYTGTIVNRRLVRSNEPYGPGGTVSTTSGNFSCPYVAFQQVTSTATSSVSRYGLRPVGMYEGSGLAISNFGEASRVADAFISDLAEPTVDMSIRTRVLDLRIGDLVALPNDPKGRWVKSTGSLIPAIVGIKEHYESGNCYADYDLRHTRPTAGTKLFDRIRARWGMNSPAVNAHDVITDHLSLKLQSRMGRFFSIGFPGIQRREMSLRDDKVEWHISTSSGFRPGPNTLVYRGRADHLGITQDGTGADLTPGTTYYLRFRSLDIYGNPSQITGLNSASAASVPSVYVRYLDQRPEAFVAQTTLATTSLVGTTFTPWALQHDSGGDAAGITFDNFGNYNTSSSMWRAPTTGHYSITHRSYWLGDGSKPADGHTVVGGVQHISSGTLVGEYSLTVASVTAYTAFCLLSVNANVFCQSGDFLRLCVAQFYRGLGSTTGNRAYMIATTTATRTYPFTTFALISES